MNIDPSKVTNLQSILFLGAHHLIMSGSATSPEHKKCHWNREGGDQVCGSRFSKISMNIVVNVEFFD